MLGAWLRLKLVIGLTRGGAQSRLAVGLSISDPNLTCIPARALNPELETPSPTPLERDLIEPCSAVKRTQL